MIGAIYILVNQSICINTIQNQSSSATKIRSMQELDVQIHSVDKSRAMLIYENQASSTCHLLTAAVSKQSLSSIKNEADFL